MIHSSINLPAPAQSPTPSPSASPAEQAKIITLICDEKCTEAEKDKIKKVEAKLNETLASKCFEDYITDTARKFNNLQGKTPWDIVNEMRQPQTMLVNYYSSVEFWILGFEMGGESVVHLNRVAMAYHRFDICDEASVAAHETSHAKGFMHVGNSANAFNLLTPPYQINAAFDSTAKFASNGGCCKP
jgi:hypothetical protein